MQPRAAPGRLTRFWKALTSAQRRRIVLGSLVVVSLAARDVLLFLTSAGLWGLMEVAPRATGTARASA
ncbi:MAG: hypothetical protein QOE90_2118 [Thermoplasmata archaeon]|jgi:hypothetical protein|nr:hypothetical protein [Thermoplasmata archaeon]